MSFVSIIIASLLDPVALGIGCTLCWIIWQNGFNWIAQYIGMYLGFMIVALLIFYMQYTATIEWLVYSLFIRLFVAVIPFSILQCLFWIMEKTYKDQSSTDS